MMIGRIFRQFYLHIITWLILLLLPFITYLYEPNKIADFDPYFAKAHFINIIFLASSFYFHIYYIAPKYFFTRKKIFLFLLLGLTFYIVLNFLTIRFNPATVTSSSKETMSFIRLFVGPTIVYALCIIIASMVFLYEEQARQKELNKQIKLEKTTAELTMLKLQISPHFLFNTLNNIRWLIRKQSPDSEHSIIKLSEILRYIIYEVDGPKVEFVKEIEHMKNFIALQTLRLPVKGTIALQIADDIKNRLIHPLLFIHFVENAFKYGVDSKTSPDIQFSFYEDPHGITFVSRNKILLHNLNPQTEGIGLTNAQRRLQLLYPNKHHLSIHRDEEYFEIVLQLTIDED